jgi:hypothetical protein
MTLTTRMVLKNTMRTLNQGHHNFDNKNHNENIKQHAHTDKNHSASKNHR